MKRQELSINNNNKKPELLSPAGSLEAAIAAFNFGADAVYLGVKQFSARAEAENFNMAQLKDLSGYAHQNAKKVYVTLNTLIQEAELPAAVKILAQLECIGIDGVILQDLGILRLIKQSFNSLIPHASTQMVIYNLAGALYAKELGFKRIVLARELSLNRIKEITKKAGLEVEVFIHGALCYSYSGLCLFSSHCTGASGNRGRCAYPCRDSYKNSQNDTYLPFSMRDLALANSIQNLKDAGVASLKIEGRKKSPLYVAAVTDLYRHILDEDCTAAEIEEKELRLKTIFSRPWSEFALKAKPAGNVIDPNWTGHRGVEIGHIQDVKKINNTTFLCFKTQHHLELHDGLQFELLHQNKPFGFAITILKKEVGDRYISTVQVKSGEQVLVALPEHYPHLTVGMAIYCSSSQNIKNSLKFSMPNFQKTSAKIPLAINLELNEQGISVTGTTSFTMQSIKYQIELCPAENLLNYKSPFEKLGETYFYLSDFEVQNLKNLFVPVSLLNNLRRQLLDLIKEDYEKYIGDKVSSALIMAPRTVIDKNESENGSEFIIKTDQLDILKAAESFTDIKEFIFELNSNFNMTDIFTLPSSIKSHIRFALPNIIKDQSSIHSIVTTLASCGFENFELGNLSHFKIVNDAFMSKKRKLNLTANWSCYALNHCAIEQILNMGVNRLTLSPEDDVTNIETLLTLYPDKLDVIAYQDTPLFISEACPYAARYGCKGINQCKFKELEFTSKRGTFCAFSKHFIANQNNISCLITVYNKNPFSLAGKLDSLIPYQPRLKIEFINRKYQITECLKIVNCIKQNQTIIPSHLANFERGLK